MRWLFRGVLTFSMFKLRHILKIDICGIREYPNFLFVFRIAWLVPNTKVKLRHFLGLLQFFKSDIQTFSSLVISLFWTLPLFCFHFVTRPFLDFNSFPLLFWVISFHFFLTSHFNLSISSFHFFRFNLSLFRISQVHLSNLTTSHFFNLTISSFLSFVSLFQFLGSYF